MGGSAAISEIKLHQPVICFMISLAEEIIGVHDARISISASSLRGESFPNEELATRVTVPLGAVSSQPAESSDSRNQFQPFSGNIGSSCMMESTSARTKVTQRYSPSHVSCPPGSCNKTKRPDATSSSASPSKPLLTSAENAKDYVASFCGAGTSSKIISDRGVKVRTKSIIRLNSLISTL